MSKNNSEKQEKKHHKFKAFVCYDKEDCEKASVLESILDEKGFGIHLADSGSHGNFISEDVKDMIRLSICFIAVITSNFLNSSLINQEIGYAQGKGLKVILFISTKSKNEIQDIDKKLTVVEFNEDNFRQQCLTVADKVAKMVEILDEPVDFASFLDFYAKMETKSGKVF
ncbi:MAG: TIR domain-containing protein [Nitrosotalea sp.]